MRSRSKASRPPGMNDHKGFSMYLINYNTVWLASSTRVHKKLLLKPKAQATQVEGELTHHTYTHFQLVDISLEAVDKFMRMMGTFGWTARSGVSTMPATFAYRSACEEYSPRQPSIFCLLLTSALPVTKERFFSSRFRANPHIAGHLPSVLGRNSHWLSSQAIHLLSFIREIGSTCGCG